MTGFGSAEGSVLGGRVSIEIRPVNHRYFNAQLKLPFELAGTESQLRERLPRLLERGHVKLSPRWREPPATEAAVTLGLARAPQAQAGVPVDEARLAVEVALLADRVDITEELVRLRSHLEACREALAGDGTVGKQLGFLAQELLREVNTIGSRANDAVIAQTVIAMKGELEKFREQLENLE